MLDMLQQTQKIRVPNLQIEDLQVSEYIFEII